MGSNYINTELKRKYEKYSLFIGDYDSISIDYLASAVGVSPQIAIAELQAIASCGYFGNDAYIDYFTRKLVLRSSVSTGSQNFSAFGNNIKNTIINNVSSAAAAANRQVAANRANKRKQRPKVSPISKKAYANKTKT